VTALAVAAPAVGDGGVASRLEALLDPAFLAGAGWDWQTLVLSASAAHPTLGWSVCQVPDCGAMAEGAAGLCPGCTTRMSRNGGDRPPATCANTYRQGVGRCVVGCARPWESRRRPLCDAHDYQQRVVLDVSVEVFLARPDVLPLPGFGPCVVLACTRLRHSRFSPLCKAHQRRWGEAQARDPQLECGQWRRIEPAIAEGGEISMRGLPHRVVAELLYGLQQRSAEGIKTHRAILRPLCDDLRRTQVASISQLPAPPAPVPASLAGHALPPWPVFAGG